MIPFDVEYFKPSNAADALDCYEELTKATRQVQYLGGSTEFITFARIGKLRADVVIDLKGIEDCQVLQEDTDQITLGSAVTLNAIAEHSGFPLLSKTVRHIADHTSRNKITLGGNLHSRLPYKEAVLPLLVADADAVVINGNRKSVIPLKEYLHEKNTQDTILLQIKVKRQFAAAPFRHFKCTRSSAVGYPLISAAAVIIDEKWRIAFSGLGEEPVRSLDIELILNDQSMPAKRRINEVLEQWPGHILEDELATAEYRKFLLGNVLEELLETGGDQ